MWPFGGNPGGKAVNREMRIELATQCGIPYPDSEGLLSATSNGRLAGRKIKNFRIFQPTGVTAEDRRSYDDIPGDAIMYDGIIERDGAITVNKGRKMR